MWDKILAQIKEDLGTQGVVKNLSPMSSREGGVEVHSECIKTVSYDKDTQDMELTFVKGKKTYSFPNVPESKFLKFMESPSKGSAYWKYFR